MRGRSGWFGESYRHYLAAKGYFVARKDAKYLTLYHGTTKSAAELIKREGLNPQKDSVRSGYVHVAPNVTIARAHAGGSETKFMDELNKVMEEKKNKTIELGRMKKGGAVEVISPRLTEKEVLDVIKRTADEPAVLEVKVPVEELKRSPETHNATVNPAGAESIGEVNAEFPGKGFYRYEYVLKRVPPENVRELSKKEIILRSTSGGRVHRIMKRGIDASGGDVGGTPTWKNKALVQAYKQEYHDYDDGDRDSAINSEIAPLHEMFPSMVRNNKYGVSDFQRLKLGDSYTPYGEDK